MKKKNCLYCDMIFIPKTGNQKYCTPKHQRKQVRKQVRRLKRRREKLILKRKKEKLILKRKEEKLKLKHIKEKEKLKRKKRKRKHQKWIEKNKRDLYYVYIIHCNGKNNSLRGHKNHYYKIGITNNLITRLNTAQNDNPFELKLRFWARVQSRDYSLRIEQNAHKFCEAFSIRGEWFSLTDSYKKHAHNINRQALLTVIKFIAYQEGVVEVSESLLNITETKAEKNLTRYYIQDNKRKIPTAFLNY